VAILDADKEGFLRSERSLIQTGGRAARNVNGKVIMYADNVTGSMRRMIDETNRRRELQRRYNEEHNITPTTVYKTVEEILGSTRVADAKAEKYGREAPEQISESKWQNLSPLEREEVLERLEQEMLQASKQLEFERAAELRDEIERLQTGKKKTHATYAVKKPRRTRSKA
jgi:excinuclease ABC subunit B